MSKCQLCGSPLKPPRTKFCCNKHKDRYHNINNPRGKYAYLKGADDRNTFDDIEEGWDGHK